jgi:hypothetical protein
LETKLATTQAKLGKKDGKLKNLRATYSDFTNEKAAEGDSY